MIKGVNDKKVVQKKGVMAHGIAGKVPAPGAMKGRLDSKRASSDSVMRSMSMKKSPLKGC